MPRCNSTQENLLVLKKDNTIILGQETTTIGELSNRLQTINQLEQRNKLFQALAGSIAHELRNPLGAVSMSAECIQEQLDQDFSSGSKQSIAEYLGYIQQSTDSALSIIDLILNNIHGQEIDTSQFTLLSITAAVEKALSLYPFKNDDNQRVIVDIYQNFTFKGSQILFNYVLFNLLKNAIYYFAAVKDARIMITVTATDSHNLLIFKDTGVGIAQDKLATLFDDFITSNKPEGTGLGLSFCKRAMQAFGGNIGCNSELGEYTEFTLTFPK